MQIDKLVGKFPYLQISYRVNKIPFHLAGHGGIPFRASQKLTAFANVMRQPVP